MQGQKSNPHQLAQTIHQAPSIIYSASKDYETLGHITLYSDGQALIGLTMPTQQYTLPLIKTGKERTSPPVKEIAYSDSLNHSEFRDGFAWLDTYTKGQQPKVFPALHLLGTDFRCRVWHELLHIPYGQVITYGDLAKRIYKNDTVRGMQARAIGGAVGHNPLPIIIPCHRVVGSHKQLTGYTGGLHVKKALLTIEGLDIHQYKDA